MCASFSSDVFELLFETFLESAAGRPHRGSPISRGACICKKKKRKKNLFFRTEFDGLNHFLGISRNWLDFGKIC